MTAIDGDLVVISVDSILESPEQILPRAAMARKRDLDGYEEVFPGTGPAGIPNITDASIEGTAYLTYTVLPNSTYDVDACLSFCDRVEGCGMLPPSSPPST